MGKNSHRTLAKLARTPDAPGPVVQRDWGCPKRRNPTQEVIMTEPFIFIGSYQVKPGHLEEARHRLRDVSALVEEREPRLRSFHFYLDQARERVICVQIHPDAEWMATHIAVITKHLATAWDWLEPGSSTQQVWAPHRGCSPTMRGSTTRTSTVTRSSLPALPAT